MKSHLITFLKYIFCLQVRVWEVDQDMSTANDTIVSVGRELEATVSDLSPGKIYNLRVLAYSNGGDGRMSSPTYVFQMGKLLNILGHPHRAYNLTRNKALDFYGASVMQISVA